MIVSFSIYNNIIITIFIILLNVLALKCRRINSESWERDKQMLLLKVIRKSAIVGLTFMINIILGMHTALQEGEV